MDGEKFVLLGLHVLQSIHRLVVAYAIVRNHTNLLRFLLDI